MLMLAVQSTGMRPLISFYVPSLRLRRVGSTPMESLSPALDIAYADDLLSEGYIGESQHFLFLFHCRTFLLSTRVPPELISISIYASGWLEHVVLVYKKFKFKFYGENSQT